jgi:GT2 family glycosyltransferase
MRENRTTSRAREETAAGWGRVTSMARWLARRRPAGATPRLSVVMPVYNAEDTLAECLTRLCATQMPDVEVVLVDDGSTDQSRAIAAGFPVRVVRSGGRVGPAAARNLGARVCEGDVVLFIDSDVMVRPDTLTRLLARFDASDVDGVVGVQAADMRHRNLVSQYKNLWMRWTYVRQQGDVALFYTTAAAIRREAFLRSGGFDQGYGNPNVEDTAFGQKLASLGIRVRVDPELEVEHVKHYSLAGLLRTDYRRAVALTRMKLRQRGDFGRNTSSVPTSYMASMPLVLVGGGTALVGLILGSPALLAVSLVTLIGMVGLNWGFLRAIRRDAGVGRAIGAIPLLWTELMVAGVGAIVGVGTYLAGRRY